MIPVINLAYYERKDWDYFLSIIPDREKMHESWDDWYQSYNKLKIFLISQGLQVRDITVNIQELKKYCWERNIPMDGKARSQFVQEK